MKSTVRRVTNDIISAVEDGFLSWEEVARACLSYLSEDDVKDVMRSEEWAIADDDLFDEEDDDEDEDVCPDCGKEFGKDGRCYNQDCVAYDPTSQYFDDEEDTIMNRLTVSNFKQIDRIADRYNTSSPVSGNWDTEATHERDAIAKELRLTKEEANEVMIEYLGFDITKLQSEEHPVDEEVKKDVCSECGKEFGEDSRCYNQNCKAYDPISQYFDSEKDDILKEEIEEDALVGSNYLDLDFHEEGVLIGDIQLEYTDLPVMDQFDNDVEVAHTLTVFVSPDLVLDFICSETGLNRKELTFKQAQEHIDYLAKNPESFYDLLREYFVEEATEEAQQEVAADGLH